MGRSKASALVALAACGGHPAPVLIDPFADDPLAVVADLERHMIHARSVDVVGRADQGDEHLAGLLHLEPERVAWAKISAPTFAKWSSLDPADPDARDVPPPTWAESLAKELVRQGLAPTWRAVLAHRDPDILHGDVDATLDVADAAWQDGRAASRVLTFTLVDRETGDRAAVELELDARGWPVRRRQGDAVETYSRFDVQ